MSYLVLARKYRPQTLGELAGQQHIERALSNAVRMDRVAHAYLFCGARGTGKTSTARILAKMLNCETGPTAEPCGTCRPCTEIASSSSIDVYELDAASNRGVNEIRELREGVGYAPARDRNKIYIVDEAHMLTTEAANAFLKTLEEPPDHAIFILATTDPQRLPITIRSRCQRYDFRRVRSAEVVALLAQICAKEGVQLGQEALFLVAREGDGSMRDSLSVLDQVIAFGGDNPSADEVASLLGVADRQRTAGLIEALLSRDTVAALHALAAAHSHGIDLRSFARTLALAARDLLVIRLATAAARDLVDRSESEIEGLRNLCEGHDSGELERLSHVLLELAESVAQARHPRLVLEMGVVRLCRAARLTDIGDLAARVDALLRMPRGVLPAPASGGPGRGGRAEKPESRPHSAPPSSQAQPRHSAATPHSAPPRAEPRPPAAQPGAMPARRRVDTSRSPRPAKPASDSAAKEPSPAPSPSPVAAIAQPLPRTPTATVQAAGRQTLPLVSIAAAPAVAAPIEKPRGRSLRDEDLAAWEVAVREEIGDAVVASLLARAVVKSSGPGRVELAFGNGFHTTKASERAVLELFCKGAALAFGGTYEVTVGDVVERARGESLVALRKAAKDHARSVELEALRVDESVLAVIELFDGRLEHTVSEQELATAGDAP